MPEWTIEQHWSFKIEANPLRRKLIGEDENWTMPQRMMYDVWGYISFLWRKRISLIYDDN
jgi:hypothetical protein